MKFGTSGNATIIGEDIILTAAHCLEYVNAAKDNIYINFSLETVDNAVQSDLSAVHIEDLPGTWPVMAIPADRLSIRILSKLRSSSSVRCDLAFNVFSFVSYRAIHDFVFNFFGFLFSDGVETLRVNGRF